MNDEEGIELSIPKSYSAQSSSQINMFSYPYFDLAPLGESASITPLKSPPCPLPLLYDVLTISNAHKV